MSPDPDTVDALRRAGARAAYHLLRAGVESLKALEAVIDELGAARRGDGGAQQPPVGRQQIGRQQIGRQQIDIE